MRNLKNIGHSIVQFSKDIPPCSATAWDTNNDCLICAFGPTANDAFIELRRIPKEARGKDGHNNGIQIAAWDAPCPNPESDHDRILSLQHFGDSLATCLVLAGGDIVMAREEPQPDEDAIEIVGTVDVGIAAAAWSPDEELLAVVTSARTLLFMTRQFENTVKVEFSLDDVKASNHVSVGWGKAETQFKGKRAKALRDPTVPEQVDEGLVSPSDDGGIYLSWRGDGAYLAVSAVEDGKRRMIRVYSREGILDSVSEPVDYLEGPIAWRPAGNIIAAFQNKDELRQIVFFERNGLRHGEFSIRSGPSDEDRVKSLAWNLDSSVLAVGYTQRTQLWTMNNYHYYLKQDIPRQHKGTEPWWRVWHPERPLRLAIAQTVCMETFDYTFSVCHSPSTAEGDPGIVAVIDGQTLKLTPLRLANIPPPMALHELNLEDPILDVTLDAAGATIVALTTKRVLVYHCDYHQLPFALPTLDHARTWATSSTVSQFWPRQIVVDASKAYCTLETTLESGIHSCRLGLGKTENSTAWESAERISSICTGANGQSVYQLDALGNLSALKTQADDKLSGPVTSSPTLRLPASTVQAGLATVNGTDIAFGLTSGGSIFANERLLARNCTSFTVTDAHLIFTTNQHLLKFVHLSKAEDLEVPPDAPETDERCRSIERGARLITVIPSAYSVVLQMPRGNLETIYPRALVLASIRQDIRKDRFKQAFLTCRNQRVDMNILHDHDPERFMRSVGLIIRQLKKSAYIDLFLAALRNEDVSETMYKETLPTRLEVTSELNINGSKLDSEASAGRGAAPLSKVNRICDAFLAELEAHSAKNLRNIITAHVCKSPPDLVAGLQVVKKLGEQGQELAERGAEHICFLADVNQLYNEALGLYDLELVLLVAQQSQKDPREYLPYLQSLQQMTDLRKKYSIDNDLGRYTKALDHLHALGEFDELKRYMQRHELYAKALDLYRYQQQQHEEVMRLFANFLGVRNRFAEAAIIYEHLSDFGAASDAYRQANMWQEALSSATLVPVSAADLVSLAQDLAGTCEETKDFQAAACIYRDYLSDPQGAVRLFCKGYHISEAIRLVGLHQQPTWLESNVDPGLVDGMATMTEMLGECREQLRAQVPRLRELREKKSMDPLAFYGGEPAVGDGIDIPDNISIAPTDASTTGTFMTRYTNRSGTINTQTSRKTSKNRRREERKRAKGKKGTVYEEEYLINSIARLIERVDSVGDDVRRLVQGLIRRRMRERALALEQIMVDVVEGCKNCIPEVFQTEKKEETMPKPSTEEVDADVDSRPLGPDGVLWDSLDSLGKKVEPPVIKDFARLSLLG